MRLGELARADPSLRIAGDSETRIGGLAFDVRYVRRGDLFAALDGEPFRGHAVAGEAAARGAAALLATYEAAPGTPTLLAAEPRVSLAHLAAEFHGRPSRFLSVIGVTGTDGKTTTAHLTETVLRRSGAVTGSITTVGTSIAGDRSPEESRLTTPEAPDVQAQLRRMVDAGVRWAIVEATSHGLALNRLDEVSFRIGAVTNVTHEHLDFHGTPESYRRAKAILLERARASGGTAVVNADDPSATAVLEAAGAVQAIRFGLASREAEVRADDVDVRRSTSAFTLVTPEGSAHVRLPLPGLFNVANALCAAACAHAVGLDASTIGAGLEAAEPVPGRMTTLHAGQPFAVVVDYAHSPAAVEHVLELLRRRHPAGRLVVVLGSAGQRDRLKRPWLGEVAGRRADYSVFTSEDPRRENAEAIIAEIAAGAVSAGARGGETFACVADRREAIRHAFESARPGDCVALLGKGHERSIVWGDVERPWDELAVARSLLGELGYAA
jgi:UDP-N-acetylmuramoyl-L-alanyl-D-glutamate--2,6-diaminopimelate ligase